ncbi:MAG: hypothetical protein AAGA28_02575 [Pseudomonadota bacterium]
MVGTPQTSSAQDRLVLTRNETLQDHDKQAPQPTETPIIFKDFASI